MNDEEKYKSIRASLKALPKVKARAGFEDRLFQRIKQLEEGELAPNTNPVKESKFKEWFANLLRPSFVPALGLTVILLVGIVVYFAYYSQFNKESGTTKQYSVSGSDQKPEFVIYVRRDTSNNTNNASNYPHEYSGLTPGETQTTTSDSKKDFGNVPSDFNSVKPAPSIEDKVRDDRISPQQKQEMQRSSDTELKGVEGKTHSEFKERIEKKAPSNYKREDDKDSEKNNNSMDGTINQNNPSVNSDETGKDNQNDSVNIRGGRGIPGKIDSKTLSKAQVDSLKAKQKAPLKAEEPDSTKK